MKTDHEEGPNSSKFSPKLHLPPDFADAIGEATIESKQWFGAAFVEYENGAFVKPEFVAIERVAFELRQSGFFVPQDTIVLPTLSLDSILEVLPKLLQIDAFRVMKQYSRPDWEDVND